MYPLPWRERDRVRGEPQALACNYATEHTARIATSAPFWWQGVVEINHRLKSWENGQLLKVVTGGG